jgi:hypothetical protein
MVISRHSSGQSEDDNISLSAWAVTWLRYEPSTGPHTEHYGYTALAGPMADPATLVESGVSERYWTASFISTNILTFTRFKNVRFDSVH